MARFDVLTFEGRVPLVLEVQCDLLAHLETRIVVPLIPENKNAPESMPRLKPRFRIDGADYTMSTTEMSAMPCSRLGSRVTNLEGQREVIIDAIDFLLQGF